MLILPEGLSVTRSEKSEQVLTDKCRTWLGKSERKEGLHASDLLDPKQAYWKRKKLSELPDRLVNMFIVGLFGHAIVLSAVDGVEGISLASDAGSMWSEDLGIWYSPDKTINGIPRELKTTRSFFDAKTVKDLSMYIEQLMIYMVAEKSALGQIWVLYMNLKDAEGKTSPCWRVFTVKVTEAELEAYRQQLKDTAASLRLALDTGDPSKLSNCRAFKCGKANCEFYEDCKPDGRYGIPKTRWEN